MQKSSPSPRAGASHFIALGSIHPQRSKVQKNWPTTGRAKRLWLSDSRLRNRQDRWLHRNHEHRPRPVSKCLPRVLHVQRLRTPRLHEVGSANHHRNEGMEGAEAAQTGSKHPSRQCGICRIGSIPWLSAGRLLSPLSENRRPLARSRALGNPMQVVAVRPNPSIERTRPGKPGRASHVKR